jgi:hypothetical protein
MLALVASYVALIFVSAFIMDWFVITPESWTHGSEAHGTVDLWVVTHCDRMMGCASKPLEATPFAAFRPYAVVTLWTTAASAALVLLRTGTCLLGKRVWRHVPTLGYVLVVASFASVIVTVVAMQSVGYIGGSMQGTTAPVVLIAAHAVGLLAMASATRSWGRVEAVRGGGIPQARVVS